MSEKKFQIRNVHLKESNFKFQGEEIFYTDRERFNTLKYQINLKEIEYNKISDNQYLSNLGVVVRGIVPKKDAKNENEIETMFEVGCLYSCLSDIEGFSEEEIFKIQHINLSQILYPYVRSEVNRIMSDTVIPKIQLQLIDFATVYFNKFEKNKVEQKESTE
tara:strand:- start:39523 stop:40008 length:486 start_codon:yes stop_codon:yes gene_type:complete